MSLQWVRSHNRNLQANKKRNNTNNNIKKLNGHKKRSLEWKNVLIESSIGA